MKISTLAALMMGGLEMGPPLETTDIAKDDTMTYYFIDLENTGGTNWADTIKSEPRHCKIFMFYTPVAPCVPWSTIVGKLISMIQSDYVFRWYKCHQGKNALDFQLICTLGQQTATDREKKRKYVIVSNDQGYDAAVKMLCEQGYDTKRSGF